MIDSFAFDMLSVGLLSATVMLSVLSAAMS
jgi:hypothetical protein